MIRVNLFDPLRPNVYGTATWEDLITVCGAAMTFCLVVGLVVFGIVRVLLV